MAAILPSAWCRAAAKPERPLSHGKRVGGVSRLDKLGRKHAAPLQRRYGFASSGIALAVDGFGDSRFGCVVYPAVEKATCGQELGVEQGRAGRATH